MTPGALPDKIYIHASGEMADLTRAFHWSNTSLKDPSLWPAPLLNAVNLILDSSFPMFIWWGEEKIQFYNDAYVKILGTDATSKHPQALGQRGDVCWQEIWHVISPLLEEVLQTCTPLYMEDQLIPIYRHGILDNVYWTFSYNVLRNQYGQPDGILVVCTETTEKVKFQQDIAASNIELAASNEGLAATNEQLQTSLEDLDLSRHALQQLNEQLEQRVDERTAELSVARSISEMQKKRLASVIKQVPAGLAILSGTQMVVEMANTYMLDIWNRDHTVIGQPLLAFLPELREQAFPALLDKVLKTGVSFASKDAPVEFVRNGEIQIVYMDYSYTPLADAGGLYDGILVLAEDVTERTLAKQREQQLSEELGAINEELASANEELTASLEGLAQSKQLLEYNLQELALSEMRFQSLIQDANVGIIVLMGEDMRVEIVNDAYARLIGRTTDELYQQCLFHVIPEAEYDFRQIIDQVRNTGEPVFLYDAPYKVNVNDGTIEGFLDLIYQPFREPTGTLNGTMVICQDVTVQVKARQTLEQSEQRLRFMLDAIPQQVWTAAPDGHWDYVNENISTEFGKNAAQIIGNEWQSYIHPDDVAAANTAWLNALQTGNEYQAELRLRFKDGQYHWHLARALPLVEQGMIKLWIGTHTNIELQKQNERNKDEFLSIASHELKTPLTSLKAFNQMMGRTTDMNRLSSFIDRSALSISRLEKLIHDLLDVTKINAGKLTYDLQPFNFALLLSESVDSMRHMSSHHQILLQSNVNITLEGDRFRLEQVISNFISNAIKYSPNSDEILVNAQVESGFLTVSVQDFGIGIPSDKINLLFSRYFRLETIAMRFEGLGLGLFISSEIITRHKGTFWAESEEGKGATFFFRLPVFAGAASS